MRITEDQISAFFVGAALGWLLTYWTLTRHNRVMPGVRRLVSEIQSSIETLGAYNDLTPAQRRLTMPWETYRLVSLEEMLDFYQWAQKLRESGIRLDPIVAAAQAIICEKLLGLTRMAAVRAQQQGKRAEDLRTLLPSKKTGAPKISD